MHQHRPRTSPWGLEELEIPEDCRGDDWPVASPQTTLVEAMEDRSGSRG